MRKAIVLVLLFLCIGCVFGQSQSRKPNVIVIYSDDQGYADLNCYGSKDLYTPNLDKLASDGLRFTNFYSASPICSPSRASLLTGRYPQRTGLVGNAGGDYGNKGMRGEEYTLAELFKSSGYATAHIGKWHLGFTADNNPLSQGFDYSFGFMGGCIDNYSHYYYWGGPNRHDLWYNGQEIWKPGKLFSDMMVSEACKFLKQNQRKPFFIYFALNNPHYPLQGEPKWLEYYKNVSSPRKQYAAAISTMDEKIGLLLKEVDKLGLRDNTIVIFQADQGFSKEERSFGGGGSAGKMRGSKFSVFEGGIKVPAIIRWQGHIRSGVTRKQFCTNLDWYPTLAEFCKISLPQKKVDGKNIVDIIQSDKTKTSYSEFFWQCLGTKSNPQWAVREGNWKLMRNPIESSKEDLDADGFMLVDLAKDSTEQINHISAYPEIAGRLKQKYQNWLIAMKQQD